MLSGFRNIAANISRMWSGSMYPAVSPDVEDRRPRHPNMAADFADLLPQTRFRQSVSDCRWFAIASDIIGGALKQKTDYVSASHWATHYAGPNRAWGELAEEKCQQLDAYCNTRGERYDWATTWGLTIPHLATDGGVFLNLTETETGWPLIQPIEAPRVASRDDKPTVQPKSARAFKRDETSGKLTRIYTPYAGLKIVSGIIYDDAGREVAYRVLGNDDKGADDVDVSAQDMIHLAGPRWFSEGRPLPEMAGSVLALRDIHEARASQLAKQVLSSRLTVVEENDTGKAPPAAERMRGTPGNTPAGSRTELIEQATWRFIKSGRKITPVDLKTPPGEWMAYDDKIIASALHSLGWRIEMLDPKQSGSGANTRAFADQINTAIQAAFDLRVPALLRVRRWQIAKLIARGDLPKNSDWWKWGCTPPAEFSPDPGRAISSELEAVRAGAQSMAHLIQRWGQRPREVLEQQARYIIDRREIAAEFGLTPEEAAQLGTLAQPGDAPPAPTPDAPEPQTKPDDKEEKDAAMAAQLSAQHHSEILAALRSAPAPSVHFGERAIVVEAPITVSPPSVTLQAPAPTFVHSPSVTLQAAAPVVIPAPVVNLEAQPAPVVNITTPAPVVNVTTPAPVVNVTNNVEAAPAAVLSITRDGAGRIKGGAITAAPDAKA
jgi:hypothetical protein